MTIQNKNKTIIIQRLFAYLIVLKYTQLIKIFNPDGVSAECTYDPFGRRISKTVQGEKEFEENDNDKEHDKYYDKDDDDHNVIKTTYYVYDNEDILMEYNDKGKITARYTHGLGIDEPLAFTNKHGETYYYHADGLGSIVALTDSKQHVVQSYNYSSFGLVKRESNKIKQPYMFTGREWDEETGLYYLRARTFDPNTGKFIQKDPVGFNGGDINLYRYVRNRPTVFVDPWGLQQSTVLSQTVPLVVPLLPLVINPTTIIGVGVGGTIIFWPSSTAESEDDIIPGTLVPSGIDQPGPDLTGTPESCSLILQSCLNICDKTCQKGGSKTWCKAKCWTGYLYCMLNNM